MADQKLSELTAATSAAAADTIYVVQGGTSKNITVANLFADVDTDVKFGDTISIDDSETLTGAGAVSVAKTVTILSNPGANGTLTIAAGSTGQIKIIVMTSNTGSNVLTLDDSDLGHDTVIFNEKGDTATLIYIGSKWWVIGGTAAVTN
jgi:hypothetical protein